MVLYLFNPEHDYALANNDPHFVAPATAVKFADDCALFLSHLYTEPGYIFFPYRTNKFFYDLQTCSFTEHVSDIEKVIPWGWDALMCGQLKSKLVGSGDIERRVTDTHILSHRRISIEGMNFLRKHCTNIDIPPSATPLFTEKEVSDYIRTQQEVILKSPYSGNGRGNLYTHKGIYSDTLRRQTTGVIRRQGAILGEPLYNVVQDFAMEFSCKNQQANFAGFSIFNTRHYGYAGNQLCTDEVILQNLSKWVATSDLLIIQQELLLFVQERIAPFYEGYLGVDMFIYEENEKFKINPMVEINVRMTMGMAAHIIYEKHVHHNSTGTMRLEFRPRAGDMLKFQQQQQPMQCHEGRWYNGTRSLTPIDEETQYAVWVEITPFLVSLQP